MAELTELEIQTLDFEKVWQNPPRGGRKEAAIREVFDESSTRYYSRLNALLDNTHAWMYAPQLVKRLRRLRAARERQRSARRLGFDETA